MKFWVSGFILHLANRSFSTRHISLLWHFFVEFAEFSEGLEPIFWDAGIGKTVCEHVNCWIDWTLRVMQYSYESLKSCTWRAVAFVSGFKVIGVSFCFCQSRKLAYNIKSNFDLITLITLITQVLYVLSNPDIYIYIPLDSRLQLLL